MSKSWLNYILTILWNKNDALGIHRFLCTVILQGGGDKHCWFFCITHKSPPPTKTVTRRTKFPPTKFPYNWWMYNTITFLYTQPCTLLQINILQWKTHTCRNSTPKIAPPNSLQLPCKCTQMLPPTEGKIFSTGTVNTERNLELNARVQILCNSNYMTPNASVS